MLHKEFFNGRNIPDYHPESIQYVEWWKEEKKRCIEGLEINGERVSGEFYFFLNFCKINLLDQNQVETFDLPRYCGQDRGIFDFILECKRLGKDFMMITGRGAGKSYIAASLIEHSYTLFPNTYNIVSASIEKHLRKLWEKIFMGLNNMPDAFYHNRIVTDTKSYEIKSGLKYIDEFGRERTKGYNSSIEGIVYGNEAGKVRGGRPKFVVYEEIGAWSGAAKLIDCRNATNASLSRGIYTTGTSLFIGTGGEMESGGSIDAKKMFYNPEGFNLMTFPYKETKTAFFLPAYKKLEGFYEVKGSVIAKEAHEKLGFKVGEKMGYVIEDGINDDVGAKAFLERRRESKKDTPSSFNSEIQEYPFTPEEAFTLNSFSPFSILRDRLYELEVDPSLKKLIKRGTLKLTSEKDPDGLPIVKFTETADGPIQILEPPVRDKTGRFYKNLYVSGCDPYDQDKAPNSESKGSMFVFKRGTNVMDTGGLFVAQYTDRPEQAHDFYYNTLLLNLYYGAIMLAEHNTVGIFKYYIDRKYSFLLAKKPKVAYREIKNSKSVNVYGLQMNDHTKTFCIDEYRKYCLENPDQFFFIDQVEDHLQFNREDNRFDRTMASMLAYAQNAELYNIMIEEQTKPQPIKRPKWRTVNGRFVFA